MNKKIFASALLAIAAFASMNASAAITYGNSLAVGANQQTANAVAAPGGASVRANDITLMPLADGDLQPASTSAGKTGQVVLRLPKGLNFDGAPTYKVTPATATMGLTLKDSAGDPTLDAPEVIMSDANGDGGMDRAVINVARKNLVATNGRGDTLTISVNIAVDAGVAKGVKQATINVEGGVATVNLVEVVTALAEPLNVTALTAADVRSQSAQTLTITSKPFIITIPKGTKGQTKLTFKPSTGMKFSDNRTSRAGTSTLTVNLLSPSVQTPFTAASYGSNLTAGSSATASIVLTVTGTATYTLPEDVQVKFDMSSMQLSTSSTTGERGLALSGLVTGTVPFANVSKSGSSAAMTAKEKIPTIVVGGAAVVTLPKITITENFAGDAIPVGGTATITLTPSAGLKFNLAQSATVSAGFTNATPTLSAAGVLSLSITHTAGSTTKTLTIGNLRATVAKTTTPGTMTVTVGSSATNGPKSQVITAATAVALGTVSTALPAKYTQIKTGPGKAGNQSSIEIKETTYGAITRNAQSVSTPAHISFTPSSNATITAVTFTYSGYAAGTSPTIAITTRCNVDAVGSATFICPVEAESSAVVPGTSTVTAKVTWTAKATAAVGSDVVLTLGGNAGVSGEHKVGTVGVTTKAAVSGAIPDVKPGSLTAASLATVTITEMFTGAVSATSGTNFRLLAPAGVSFQTGAAGAGISSAAISSTFRPNDTLTLAKNASTNTITFTAKAIFADTVPSGLVSFELVDGNTDNKNLSNITAATLQLAYADGTLEKLDAGKDASVNVGFSVSSTAKGGLTPYTVTSSDSKVGSPTITGSVVTVNGKAVGVATITVTDALGATSQYVVTVSAGAAEPEQGKATKSSDGEDSAATFTGGASIDGGTTYSSEITTADEVTINATINVDPADVGKKGGIHAVALTPVGLLMLNADGTWEVWDGEIASIATYQEEAKLAASYKVPLYSGAITAGKWRFAVIYSTIVDGKVEKLVYTTKAALLTVKEAE
jgi:hypothetical protein